MRNFKKGDRVELVSESYSGYKVGDRGTVIEYTGVADEFFKVKMDEAKQFSKDHIEAFVYRFKKISSLKRYLTVDQNF